MEHHFSSHRMAKLISMLHPLFRLLRVKSQRISLLLSRHSFRSEICFFKCGITLFSTLWPTITKRFWRTYFPVFIVVLLCLSHLSPIQIMHPLTKKLHWKTFIATCVAKCRCLVIGTFRRRLFSSTLAFRREKNKWVSCKKMTSQQLENLKRRFVRFLSEQVIGCCYFVNVDQILDYSAP